MEDRTFLIAIFGLFASVTAIAWIVARTVERLRQPQVPTAVLDLEARLARIESTLEAVAIEVERNGELQRFNAKLALGDALPEPRRIERPTTPI